MEKVVHDQINVFLSDQNILYNYQSDFRSNHSKNLCLAFLTDKTLKQFDEGLLTGMILIDLQKAFDIIMKSYYKSLKQLDSQRGLYSGLDPIFLSEYFLLLMKISSQILEKVIVGYHKVYLRFSFIFDLCEQYATSS